MSLSASLNRSGNEFEFELGILVKELAGPCRACLELDHEGVVMTWR